MLQGGRDRLLNVREAAEQLGLCTATIYGLCADGLLPHVRILNAIRIAPQDLRAFVAARREAGTTARAGSQDGSDAAGRDRPPGGGVEQ